MRVLVVVFLLAMVLCVCAVAQTQESAPSTPAASPYVAEHQQTFTFTVPDGSAAATEQKPGVFTNPELLPQLSLNPEQKTKSYVLTYDNASYVFGADCFTMRSYIVRRESSTSDATVPVGYTECMPASRVKMKSAVVEKKK